MISVVCSLHKSSNKYVKQRKINIQDSNVLEQRFLALLEVLNPTSSIHAFIEPYVFGAFVSFKFKTYVYNYILYYSAQTSRMDQSAERLKLTHRTPGFRSSPG